MFSLLCCPAPLFPLKQTQPSLYFHMLYNTSIAVPIHPVRLPYQLCEGKSKRTLTLCVHLGAYYSAWRTVSALVNRKGEAAEGFECVWN